MTLEVYGRCPCDSGWISKEFNKSSHTGIDIGWLTKYGANLPVKAWKSGVVVAAGQITEIIESKKYYPTMVVLKHEDADCTWITRYWHLVKGSCKVKVGDTVTQGQVLGTRGNTGLSLGVHLHFEVWKCPKGYSYKYADYKKYCVDPMMYTYVFDGQVMAGTPIFPKKTEEIAEPKPVERDETIHQVEVIADKLRIRESASLNAEQLFICDKGIYNVLQSQEADGYTWLEIEIDRWIATREGEWTIDLPIVKVPTQEEIIMDLRAQIDKLNKEMELKDKSITATENTLKDALTVIESVRKAVA